MLRTKLNTSHPPSNTLPEVKRGTDAGESPSMVPQLYSRACDRLLRHAAALLLGECFRKSQRITPQQTMRAPAMPHTQRKIERGSHCVKNAEVY